MAYDIASLKAGIDLLAVIESDLGPPRRQNGRWYSWQCPLHDDDPRDGGSLRVTPDTGTWFCFGCRQTGDVIAWIRLRQKLSFSDACRQLGAGQIQSNNVSARLATLCGARPGLATFCAGLQTVLDRTAAILWEPMGARALDYLHKRGLKDDTLREWKIGYCPAKFEIQDVKASNDRPVYMSKGIVIPVWMQNQIYAVKIRQLNGIHGAKYFQLTGSQPALFGADRLNKSQVLLCEGEFDALLAWQECKDLVGVASTSGGAGVWRKEWSKYLLAAQNILIAYDNDVAGDEGAALLMKASSRAHRVNVPKGKDITEFWQSGGNIREWVKSLLPGMQPTEPKPAGGCHICGTNQWEWTKKGWICPDCGPMESSTA